MSKTLPFYKWNWFDPKFITILLLLSLYCLTTTVIAQSTPKPDYGPHPYNVIKDKPDRQYGTWIWNTYNLFEYDNVNDKWTLGLNTKKNYFQFIKNERFTDIYVQYDPDLFKMPEQYDLVKEMLSYFSDLSIGIHLLVGDKFMHRVGTEDYDRYVVARDFLESYNDQLTQDTNIPTESKKRYSFTGFHVDCEPFMDDDWPPPNNVDDLRVFQQFHLDVQTFCHEQGLVFGTDISDGFEYIEYDNTFGKGLLSDWLIREMDFIVVMSYRYLTDKAIEAVQHEIEYQTTDSNCTPPSPSDLNLPQYKLKRFKRTNGCAGVSWSLETDDVTWGERFGVVTFYGKKRKELNDAIATIDTHFTTTKNQGGYGGFAIHMFPTYEAMGDSFEWIPTNDDDFDDETCSEPCSCCNKRGTENCNVDENVCQCKKGWSGDTCLVDPNGVACTVDDQTCPAVIGTPNLVILMIIGLLGLITLAF